MIIRTTVSRRVPAGRERRVHVGQDNEWLSHEFSTVTFREAKMSEKKAKAGNIEAKGEAKAETKPAAEAKPAAAEEKLAEIGVFVCN